MHIMGSLPDLPHGSSPHLALVHPTQEELLIQFNLNGAEWRGALSQEAYLRREHVLSQQDQTKDGGISYWILVDKTAKQNPLDPTSSARLPLASCETYRKKALVWQDGKLQETICHGIGSVFCAPHLRGRKYAQRMMQELGEALKTYQTDKLDCMFSVLFSDIGKVRTCGRVRRQQADFGSNSTQTLAGRHSGPRTSLCVAERLVLKRGAVYPRRGHFTKKMSRSSVESTKSSSARAWNREPRAVTRL